MENDVQIPAAEWPALPPLPEGEWPAQGQWTYDDYRRLPPVPDRRFEILFGVLWTTRAPTISHKTVVHRVGWELEQYQDEAPGDLVLSDPVEVILPGLAEPVKPDLLYIRAEHAAIASGNRVDGPPDLVVEVLARRTGRLDKRIKYAAYEQGRVPEYWTVDPRDRVIRVFTLEDAAYTLSGEYTPGDTLVSRVLPELRFPVARVFRH